MIDVVCLGILVADVIARPVDELPHGAVSLMDEVSLHGGGCALNTATGLGRLGLSVAVVGKVGDDTFGDFVLGLLAERNLETGVVLRDHRRPPRLRSCSSTDRVSAPFSPAWSERHTQRRRAFARQCLCGPVTARCRHTRNAGSTELLRPDCSLRRDDTASTPRSTPSTTPLVAWSASGRATRPRPAHDEPSQAQGSRLSVTQRERQPGCGPAVSGK